ncbi:MAG: trehalase family glycosidase [bacterium]
MSVQAATYRTIATLLVLLAIPLGGSGCEPERTSEVVVEELDLGPSLDVTFGDPILLTFAAPRERTSYLEDEGYTLARDEAGVARFVTDTAGDLGFGFRVNGQWLAGDEDFSEPVTIRHTTSDGVVYDFELVSGLRCQVRFVVATSRVAAVELVFRSELGTDQELTFLPWLRRCSAGLYSDPAPLPVGVRGTHNVEFDLLLQVVGPGTYVEELTDALVAPGQEQEWVTLPSCGATVREDVHDLGGTVMPAALRVAMVGLRIPLTVPAGGALPVRVYRATVASERQDQLVDELAEAQAATPAALLHEGQARLQALPSLENLSSEAALVFRSSFILLQQLMMPAEGQLAHDYYLFSREPTWWFARLGQHVHESLAMIQLAHFDPAAALASHRVFIDRVEEDGYLPYNIGPVVEQTTMGTASAPLFSYIAWELAQITGDATFLADAYDAGSRIHRFWVEQRDADGDGLAEWGGYGITESVRDLENVIWENVAAPEELEAIGLNTMLVKDASVLAQMADALGRTADASDWRGMAQERATLINSLMWDDVTGFYYHVDRDSHTFDYADASDLKRMEIAGLLPLWAGFVPADRREILLDKLTDPELFWRPGGIPGLAATDPYYSPTASQCCRWNGPVWVQWQFLLMRALLDLGEHELAVELTRRTLAGVRSQLASVHQFRELYDPDDLAAENRSMPNYVWSALVGLMMMEADAWAGAPW